VSVHPIWFSDDERLVVSPRRAKHMLDCGNTRLYELLNAKELESFLDGRSRKITVSSIKAYIARLLAAPANKNASTVDTTKAGKPKRHVSKSKLATKIADEKTA
jgi:hypothetical protein